MSLNSKYREILKHLKRETPAEISKRSSFQSSLQKLFDIASPLAEQELQKDRVLGKKKAQEDLKFLESQRTDRIAKMAGHDKKYDDSKLKNIKRKEKETRVAQLVERDAEIFGGSFFGRRGPRGGSGGDMETAGAVLCTACNDSSRKDSAPDQEWEG